LIHSLHSLACHVYGTAALLYLAFLIRQWPPLPIAGRVLIGSGLAAHGAALGMQLMDQGGTPQGMAQGLSSLSFLLMAMFLALDLRYRLPVIGAFLTPFAVAVLVPSMLMPGQSSVLPPGLRQPMLPLHVSVALVGLAAFAVASGVAVMYLLMERQVKGRKFGLLFSRLPSLQFLDDLNQRLVVGGFIALSVTLVTGAFFTSAAGGLFWQWEPKEVATLVAWAVFGALLNARLFAGWRGKRVALLTMAGFCVLVVSFVSSFPGAGGAR
jgi:ABC-type uncharacterized transport system permease subunit